MKPFQHQQLDIDTKPCCCMMCCQNYIFIIPSNFRVVPPRERNIFSKSLIKILYDSKFSASKYTHNDILTRKAGKLHYFFHLIEHIKEKINLTSIKPFLYKILLITILACIQISMQKAKWLYLNEEEQCYKKITFLINITIKFN